MEVVFADLEMSPTPAKANGADVLKRDVISRGNLFERASISANGDNLFFPQIGSAIFRPPIDSTSGSTFVVAISIVVAPSPQKEMLNVDARRHVAMVANAETFWNRSICQFPCDAMHKPGSTISYAGHSISSRIEASSPYQAAGLQQCRAGTQRIGKTSPHRTSIILIDGRI